MAIACDSELGDNVSILWEFWGGPITSLLWSLFSLAPCWVNVGLLCCFPTRGWQFFLVLVSLFYVSVKVGDLENDFLFFDVVELNSLKLDGFHNESFIAKGCLRKFHFHLAWLVKGAYNKRKPMIGEICWLLGEVSIVSQHLWGWLTSMWIPPTCGVIKV